MLEQTASVLTFAHSKSNIHRDVKSSNISRNTNKYKLADFCEERRLNDSEFSWR